MVDAATYVLYVRTLNGPGAGVARLFDDRFWERNEGEAVEQMLQGRLCGLGMSWEEFVVGMILGFWRGAGRGVEECLWEEQKRGNKWNR